MPSYACKRDRVVLTAGLLFILGSLPACQSALWWQRTALEVTATPQKLKVPPPPRASAFDLSETTDVVGELYVVTAGEDDTLFDLARRYNLGIGEIVAANPGVDQWLPGAGTAIVLPTRHVLPHAPRQGLVLNLAAMRLFYFPKAADDATPQVITHAIGIGREGWGTPLGVSKIVKKVVNPTWYIPQSILKEHAQAGDPLPAKVPPGPDNPLGAFALRLGFPSYLIHGTNKPAGIGMRVSHGCVQLYPEDIEALFAHVPLGTPVRIVNQPYLAGWRDGELYLQAYPLLSEQRRAWGDDLRPLQQAIEKALQRSTIETAIDWEKAQRWARAARGIPVGLSPAAPDLEQIVAALPVYQTSTGGISFADTVGAGSATANKGWFIQAGSFRSERNAKKLVAMLRHMGPPIPAKPIAADGTHRVLAGPFASQGEAKRNAARIESSLVEDTAIFANFD
ncbi:MAG: L,D-transpeptidase family protein [Gammaproteobacteria bacterium]